jgi:hypothetical protein
MHVHLQEIPIVEVRRVDEATRNAGDSVETCRDDVELQPAKEMHWLHRA